MEDIMQYSLDILAQEIRVDIAQRSSSEREWTVATINLCVHLAQARTCFPDNIGFGKWFSAQGLKLSHQDRAAAIAMGQNPERALSVIAATKRRCLELIHAKEFRLTSARKTRNQPAGKTSNPVNEDKLERALAAYDRRKAAGEELTWEAVRKEANTGHTVVRKAFTIRQTQEQVATSAETEATRAKQEAAREEFLRPLYEEVLAHIAKLTGAEKKRWDKRVERAHYHIEQMVTDRNNAFIRKWKEENGFAFFEARLDKIESTFTEWPHSIMRRAEYNTIMRCLHPDTAHSRSDAERAEAFRLFTHYKLKMVSDNAEDRTAAMRELRSNMPKTLEEMLARRKSRG
jgi:hypothetical protein